MGLRNALPDVSGERGINQNSEITCVLYGGVFLHHTFAPGIRIEPMICVTRFRMAFENPVYHTVGEVTHRLEYLRYSVGVDLSTRNIQLICKLLSSFFS